MLLWFKSYNDAIPPKTFACEYRKQTTIRANIEKYFPRLKSLHNVRINGVGVESIGESRVLE